MRWDAFFQKLRDMEKLLVRNYTREQFVAKCVDDPTDAAYFKTWSAKLAGLRWEMIPKFCSEDSWSQFGNTVVSCVQCSCILATVGRLIKGLRKKKIPVGIMQQCAVNSN